MLILLTVFTSIPSTKVWGFLVTFQTVIKNTTRYTPWSWVFFFLSLFVCFIWLYLCFSQHISAIHKGVRYPCEHPDCGKSYKYRTNLACVLTFSPLSMTHMCPATTSEMFTEMFKGTSPPLYSIPSIWFMNTGTRLDRWQMFVSSLSRLNVSHLVLDDLPVWNAYQPSAQERGRNSYLCLLSGNCGT